VRVQDVTGHPDEPDDDDAQRVVLRAGGLATSSTTARRWTRGGQVMHHIMDPRSGVPAASPWRTVSVTAASCVDANIASTASIIAGADAVGWLGAAGLDARLVTHAGEVQVVGNWPAQRRT
jgi:thiamine biosynthesis lipoprotein